MFPLNSFGCQVLLAVAASETPIPGGGLREWEAEIFAGIIGAVLVLAALKVLLRGRLRDLT